MKIIIIVGGKFHAFNLAREINKKKYLASIITSYPKYLVKQYGIDTNRIKSIILKEILLKIFNKFSYLKNFFDSDTYLSNYFSKKASKLINYDDVDIIIGWSSFSREAFIKAKGYNCLKILERGSTHILYQAEILKKEYSELQIKPLVPSQEIINKELEEYKLADYISVPSEFVKKTFLINGIDEKKIIKTPYGVDLEEFKIMNDQNRDKHKFKIISVGSISIRKGSHYLLKAFKELNLSNAELVFVGPIENDFKKIIKNFKNINNIKFIKKQKQSNLKSFYNNADIFVQCSIEEGLAVVQLQAMACGLPVICTENTGGAEIVDDGINGFVIPIKNIDILKEKILYLYNNNNKLKEMSLNAHEKAKSNLSWENYGNKIINTYLKLFNHNKNEKNSSSN